MKHLVAYADTDAGGVMYHGRYVELAERSRMLFIQHAGWSLSRLRLEMDITLAVHRLFAQFRRPARLEDSLEVSTQVFRHTEVRCVFRTCISSGVALLANVDAECVAISGRRAVLWPQEFLHDLRLVAGAARVAGPADSITAPATRREV